MSESFNFEEARENLRNLDKKEKENLELKRQKLKAHAEVFLKNMFGASNAEVFLIGSITQPNQFREHSDVDIVLKNFKGDRFDAWSQIEDGIQHKVELILYENCTFQDHIDQFGEKVV